METQCAELMLHQPNCEQHFSAVQVFPETELHFCPFPEIGWQSCEATSGGNSTSSCRAVAAHRADIDDDVINRSSAGHVKSETIY